MRAAESKQKLEEQEILFFNLDSRDRHKSLEFFTNVASNHVLLYEKM
jgi:hypothetical protein